MALVGVAYRLFYSGGSWNSTGYGIGHATCASPAGPCLRTSEAPVLSGLGRASGTGGAEALWVGDRLHLAFHGWTGADVGYPNRRKLHLRPVEYDPSGRPVVVP